MRLLWLLGEPQLLLGLYLRGLSVLHLLLGLLMLVDQLEVELGDFFLSHAKDATCSIGCTSELTGVEAGRSHAAGDLLQVVVSNHGARQGGQL